MNNAALLGGFQMSVKFNFVRKLSIMFKQFKRRIVFSNRMFENAVLWHKNTNKNQN